MVVGYVSRQSVSQYPILPKLEHPYRSNLKTGWDSDYYGDIAIDLGVVENCDGPLRSVVGCVGRRKVNESLC